MKFREFFLSSGKKVLTGKSAESNEDLIKQVKLNEIILHTKNPGSPFVNIKEDKKQVSKKEIYEAGIICAKFSQDWRDNKKDIVVHFFSGAEIYKDKKMKTGTFGVKKIKELKIKKEDILKFEMKLENEENS